MSTFTVTQRERLLELEADESLLERAFDTARERNAAFQAEEKRLCAVQRESILGLLHERHEPLALSVQRSLEGWLKEREGFTQVQTPAFITGAMLEKMNIGEDNKLSEQVFWLDGKKCLRPMLAPNLYIMMRELKRVSREPVKIFECGSCFRRESQGAQHLNEFTMLNLVELGATPEGGQMERLIAYADSAMAALGIDSYELKREESGVYRETLDIVVDGVEVASGAFGPMYLDPDWGIFDVWVGIGFGIERLALVKGGYRNIRRVGRSITFADGATLSV